MTYTTHKTAHWRDIKDEIEAVYDIDLYGRTIDGIHILTLYSPVFIEIRWSAEVCDGSPEGFWLDMAPSMTQKMIYSTASWERDDLTKVINMMSIYCKRREKPKPAKQLELF